MCPGFKICFDETTFCLTKGKMNYIHSNKMAQFINQGNSWFHKTFKKCTSPSSKHSQHVKKCNQTIISSFT